MAYWRPVRLSLLMTRPLGVRSVSNPQPATGAADPENLDDARRNAPLRVLTLDRVVSLKDVENFAFGFAPIGKALAVPLWHGEKRIVRLIVAGASGASVDTNSLKNLFDAINECKDPELEVKIEPFTEKLIQCRRKIDSFER